MATRNFTQTTYTDDATYRTHITAIHDAIIAAGWVQTSDTGQINFTTVSKPTAVSQTVGYAVYRMNDALHTAGSPVVLKVTFRTLGSSNSSGNSLGLRFDIGFATDGAGNLTGNSGGTTFGWNSTAATPGLSNCYSAGDGSFLVMNLLHNATGGYGQFLSIERSRDANGNDTSDGVTMVAGGPISNSTSAISSGPWISYYVPRTGAIPAAEQPAPGPGGLLNASNSQLGSNVGTFPFYPVNGLFLPPMMNIMTYMTADLGALTPVSITRYGSTHTYLPLGLPQAAYALSPSTPGSGKFCRMPTYSADLPSGTNKTNVGLLMRWE